MKCYAILVAGGSGSRMQTSLPKQFLLLDGMPVLMHTINAFLRSQYHPEIILVLNEAYHGYWRELCLKYQFTVEHQLLTGGETRFHSVKKGIECITESSAIVAIHDAVRPLISPSIIDKAYTHAVQHGNAVVVVKSKDSIRRVKDGRSYSLPREEIVLVQTPQIFNLALLQAAYTQAYSPDFTDDASVVEQYGSQIHLIEGDHENIKITFPEDLTIAEIILQKRAT